MILVLSFCSKRNEDVRFQEFWRQGVKTYQIHEKNSYLYENFARKRVVLWKIYTAGKYFTQSTVVTVATNFKSGEK